MKGELGSSYRSPIRFRICLYPETVIYTTKENTQTKFRIQSPFGHRLVARRDSGDLLPQDFCDKTMQAVTRQPNIFFFDLPRVSPGDQPLAKELEDSGYEIDPTISH